MVGLVVDRAGDLAFGAGGRAVDLTGGMAINRTAETVLLPDHFCFLVLLVDTIDQQTFDETLDEASGVAVEVTNEAIDEVPRWSPRCGSR